MLRLFVLSPRIVWKGRVNAPGGISYPVTDIPYDGVTVGGLGDVVAGRTLLIGSSDGADDYGRLRIRAGSSGSGIRVSRASKGNRSGEVNVVDNAFLTILELYEVWSRPQVIEPDGTIYKDGDIAVGDWTTYPPPVANCQPGFAATIDLQGTAGVIVVTFDGSSSFAVADGVGITNYAWSIADGVLMTGTLASAAVTVKFPPGFRYVSLTVTDGHGKNHTAYTPVYAREGAGDPMDIENFQITSHRITHEGQELTLRIFDPLPRIVYPDGTLVMVWDGEPSGTAQRSQMLFVGWHYADPAHITAERTGLLEETTLVCKDVAGKLAAFPAISFSLEHSASPDTWQKMLNPNIDKFLAYLLHWHSTALTVADWTDSNSGAAHAFTMLNGEGSNLWEQLQSVANAMTPDRYLTCDRAGKMQTLQDPILAPVGSRPSTIQTTLAISDWREIEYVYTQPPRVSQLRSGALVATTSAVLTLFCLAPGIVPGQGENILDIGHKLAANQGALNDCEGHRYARANAKYSRVSITLTRSSDRDIEPAHVNQWVQVSFPGAQRGLAFVNVRGIVWEMEITYEHTRTGATRTVTLQWEPETQGYAALTCADDHFIPS